MFHDVRPLRGQSRESLMNSRNLPFPKAILSQGETDCFQISRVDLLKS